MNYIKKITLKFNEIIFMLNKRMEALKLLLVIKINYYHFKDK
jgi:hypothetical protein